MENRNHQLHVSFPNKTGLLSPSEVIKPLNIMPNRAKFDPLFMVDTDCALWPTGIQCPGYECGLPVSAEFRLPVPEYGTDRICVTLRPVHSLPCQIHIEERYDAE